MVHKVIHTFVIKFDELFVLFLWPFKHVVFSKRRSNFLVSQKYCTIIYVDQFNTFRVCIFSFSDKIYLSIVRIYSNEYCKNIHKLLLLIGRVNDNIHVVNIYLYQSSQKMEITIGNMTIYWINCIQMYDF